MISSLGAKSGSPDCGSLTLINTTAQGRAKEYDVSPRSPGCNDKMVISFGADFRQSRVNRCLIHKMGPVSTSEVSGSDRVSDHSSTSFISSTLHDGATHGTEFQLCLSPW
jgi:hypothetical protein